MSEGESLAALPAAARVLQGSVRMPGLMRGTWGRGILLRGIVAAVGRVERGHALWRDPLAAAHGALRAAARRPPVDPTQVNAGPVWTAALEVQEHVVDPSLRAQALGFAGHLMGVARYRGAICHVAWPRSVWADTAFMAAPLMARVGRDLGRRDLEQEAVRQVRLHVELLGEGKLVRHSMWPSMAWLEDRTLWARGNAWVLGAAAEVIDILGLDVAGPIVEHAVAMAERMAERQARCGLWPVDLDDAASARESSSAALAARAMLCLARRGVGGERVRRSGLEAARAVMGCVGPDGLVGGSQGPTVWARKTPVAGTWPWTQGLVLLLAAEMAETAAGAGLW